MRPCGSLCVLFVFLFATACSSEGESATDPSAGGSGGSSAGSAGTGGGSSGSGGGPSLGSCSVFPSDNPWNRDVSNDPVDPSSDAIIANIQANGGTNLHPDFGSNLGYGIPYVVVPGDQPRVDVTFDYADESDNGPYPVPHAMSRVLP